MGVIFRIALRNLREHKTKTLIIGIIIAIGITVLVVGNSLMDTAATGIRRTYIDNYTGHVLITGKHQGGLSLFGSHSMDEVVPRIPEYEKIVEYVARGRRGDRGELQTPASRTDLPGIEAYSPQAVGQATVSIGDEVLGFVLLFGIEPYAYQRMFPENIELVAGEFLAPGEEGILLGERSAKRMSKGRELPIAPGDSVLLTGMSLTGGTRIREVKVRGIFRFRHSDPQLNMVSLIDITNLRALVGLGVQAEADIRLSEKEQTLLGEVSEEDLFGGGGALFGGSLVSEAEIVQQKHSEQSLLGILGEPGDEPVQQTDSGSWHFILIKLKNPAQTEEFRARLERFFIENEIEATTHGWMDGAGGVAQMASGVKVVFNIIVLIVAVVAVIIIMNTLVISVTERTAEIGTMRAIGAQKSFVRRMVTLETVIVSGVFGAIGVAVGGLILTVLHLTGIQAPNIFFRVIFGGEVLRPVLSVGSVIMSLVVVTVIGVVASLYPVSIALQIQPVKAMQGS